jgi:hypothetical protein
MCSIIWRDIEEWSPTSSQAREVKKKWDEDLEKEKEESEEEE